MPGSQTTPGPTGARSSAPADFAFRQVNNVGTRVANDFAAQWLAYTLPYRSFAGVLADACARIGGDVDCCSFIAVDFHHILLASLPAHSLTLRPAGSLDRPRRPSSRGFSPLGCPTKPLVSYRTNRQLSGWHLPPLVTHAFGAHLKTRKKNKRRARAEAMPWNFASARMVAGRPYFRFGLFQMSSGSLLVLHPKPLGAVDRGHEKTPTRFPAPGHTS
jgi:hypothetical protein